MIRRTNTAVRDVALVVGARWAAPWDARPALPEKPDKWTASRFLASLRDADDLGVLDHLAPSLFSDPDAPGEEEDETADRASTAVVELA